MPSVLDALNEVAALVYVTNRYPRLLEALNPSNGRRLPTSRVAQPAAEVVIEDYNRYRERQMHEGRHAAAVVGVPPVAESKHWPLDPEAGVVLRWPAWIVARWMTLLHHTRGVFFSGTLYTVVEETEVLLSYMRVVAVVYELLGEERLTVLP